MSNIIALTGATGAMGGEVLLSLMRSPKNFTVRCLINDKRKRFPAFVKKTLKKYKDRIEILRGNISRYNDCVKLVDGANYVINCASIIPPKSDHDPDGTYKSNFLGTKNIVDAILASGRGDEISYVHIATVAMYGHRAYPHLWARVGDPMISSDYDVYSMWKLKAERYVLESGLKKFVSLRQTAILHKYMFANNLKDGLMFHTVWNGALEWVTDVDSGILCKNLVERDLDGKLDGFWNRVYNIGGGDSCRVSGFETFDRCFRLTGKGAKKYFKPNWNIARNFHGVWYTDSDELENYLQYRSETFESFWKRMGRKYWYFKLGAMVPAPIISALAIKRLFKNTNAPMYWLKNGKDGRIKAFFGGREAYDAIPKKWKDYPLLCENADYNEIKDIKNAKLLEHGYDDKKPLNELTLEDLRSAASFRGGKCLETEWSADKLYQKARWQCRDGHEFKLTPYSVLKGGYWCPECCEPKPWKAGSLSDIPYYSQIYFDSHDKSEINDVFPIFDGEDDFLIKK